MPCKLRSDPEGEATLPKEPVSSSPASCPTPTCLCEWPASQQEQHSSGPWCSLQRNAWPGLRRSSLTAKAHPRPPSSSPCPVGHPPGGQHGKTPWQPGRHGGGRVGGATKGQAEASGFSPRGAHCTPFRACPSSALCAGQTSAQQPAKMWIHLSKRISTPSPFL